ncbi:hypothetical protein SALBM311S_07646 [Streptomyces alboniger]
MSQQASPRGTFQVIADALKAQIEADPDMAELPSVAEVRDAHDVSRCVVLRAFGVLRSMRIYFVYLKDGYIDIES